MWAVAAAAVVRISEHIVFSSSFFWYAFAFFLVFSVGLASSRDDNTRSCTIWEASYARVAGKRVKQLGWAAPRIVADRDCSLLSATSFPSPHLIPVYHLKCDLSRSGIFVEGNHTVANSASVSQSNATPNIECRVASSAVRAALSLS